ncbi:hypothetical protein SDC9_56839 [bioreactor metagenome]|uniref:Uncharacterized protein n=1 Tax=bioreactor metagenome TaxID=1076179 RepID=A0A644X3G9_9ZZZZ
MSRTRRAGWAKEKPLRFPKSDLVYSPGEGYKEEGVYALFQARFSFSRIMKDRIEIKGIFSNISGFRCAIFSVNAIDLANL